MRQCIRAIPFLHTKLSKCIYIINQVLPTCRENPYDTVGAKESTAMSDHVAMETNPAYGVCSSKQ